MCEKEKRETTDQCSKKDELNDIVKIIYEKLFSEIRELERNYISLIVGLIAGIGIYITGFQKFSSLQLSCYKLEAFFLLGFCFVSSIFISISVFCVSNIFGYTHRINQLILSKIEENNCLYSSKILPESWNLYNRLKNKKACSCIDPPEIYKFFRWLSLIEIGFKSLHFIFFILFKYQCETISVEKTLFLIIVVVLLILTLCKLIYEFLWSKYKRKIEFLLQELTKE